MRDVVSPARLARTAAEDLGPLVAVGAIAGLAMLARDEYQAGDVYHVIGTYMASEMKGKTLLYRWIAVV